MSVLIWGKLFSQNNNFPVHPFNKIEKKEAAFKELKDIKVNEDDLSLFYPLNNGDFWEYIVVDTTQFWGYYELENSVTKEVLSDTLMSNGITYKVLKWEKCANSADELPSCEYQRKDSLGNIHVYYNNGDHLLYNFTMDMGSVYPSQYSGHYWYISRKYKVIGFSDTLTAIDYQLYDATKIKMTRTVIENFGLTNYTGDINISPYLPIGEFYGGIINDSTYGYLLAERQKIDWNEFYPLQVGNLWIFEGKDGPFQITMFYRVIKDTLLSDRNVYKLIEYERKGGPSPSNGFYFQRLDSLGNIFTWQPFETIASISYKFSACLGDTFEYKQNSNAVRRIEDKDFSTLFIFEYPDIAFSGIYFSRGLGVVETTAEGGSSYLKGAVIDGKVYGDTTITAIEDINKIHPDRFILYQNFPNPFNPTTTIKYSAPQISHVSLIVYDLLGRRVRTLINEEKPSGEYEISFDASGLSSGVYIYKLICNGESLHKKLTILK